MMVKERGKHFDPAVLDAFIANLDEVLLARETHSTATPRAAALSPVTASR
jgi:HD-GYP domain-containing protein (c-di-GMP phosphodiesterase class II)